MSKKEKSNPFKKLTKQDVKDLTAAVKKYKALAVAPRDELGSFDVTGSGCGLCQHYYQKSDCSQCPVAIRAGARGCHSTPWMGDSSVFDMADLLYSAREGSPLRPLRTRALQEAKFLQSLIDNSPA